MCVQQVQTQVTVAGAVGVNGSRPARGKPPSVCAGQIASLGSGFLSKTLWSLNKLSHFSPALVL